MTEAFRTLDERFEALPGFPFEPRYRDVDGLRLCHLDEGEGEQPMTDAWRQFRDFVERTEDLPVSVLVRNATARIPFEVGERFAAAVNAPPPHKVERASHLLQEDAGDEIGRSIADWLAAG